METNLQKLKNQYEAESTKWNDLKIERDRIQGEIDFIDNRLNEIQSAERKNPIQEAAEMMLRGEYKGPNDINPLLMKRDDLATRRRVILTAIPMQEKIVNESQCRYSKAVGESRRGEYKAIVNEQVRAIMTLARAIENERAFRESFRSNGLSFGAGLGPSMVFTAIGELRERHSKVNYYLRQVVNAGWVTEKEIEEMKAA